MAKIKFYHATVEDIYGDLYHIGKHFYHDNTMVAGLGEFLSCTKLHAYSNCIGIIVTCITVTEAAQSFKVPIPKSGSSCSTLVSCSLTLRPRRGEGESPVKIELSQHLI